MSGSSAGTHEPVQELTPGTREMHRALVSLMEELEAVDWYQQRIDASTDQALAAVLRHNRNEEVEHAAMVLEWIRRRDPVFDRQLRTYLFTEGDLLTIDGAADAAGGGGGRGQAGPPRSRPPDPHLAIGSLREET